MLSAVILTLNEEKHLPHCLESLKWADETVVFDSFSTDRTEAVAREHGAAFLQRKFSNYAEQRNAALEAVKGDWVFFVDADERIPPALAEEVQAITRPGSPYTEAGWWVPRHNYIFGKLTLHAGWYPDHQLRLLKRSAAHYDPNRHVHELVELNGSAGYLKNPMVHINYETVPEFVAKQHQYAKYDAGILYSEGQRVKPQNYVLQPLRQFWWRYVSLQGWRDGFHGLRLSLLMAYFEFFKYRYLGALK